MWKIWPFLISREAKPASTRRHIAATLAQTVAMWSFFLLIAPLTLSTLEHRLGIPSLNFDFFGKRVLAAILFASFGSLGVWCGVIMAAQGQGTPLPSYCPQRLIILGPYRYIRNPMALSSFIQGFCVAAWLNSSFAALYVVAGALLWNFLARPWEEADLESRFGEPFLAYRREVQCWCPRLRPYVPSQAVYSSVNEGQSTT